MVLPPLGNEGFLDAQLRDLLAVLQILAVEPLAACFKRGGDDERVVEMVFVARSNIESVAKKAAEFGNTLQSGVNVLRSKLCNHRARARDAPWP